MQSKQQEKDDELTAGNCMAVDGIKLNNSSRLGGKGVNVCYCEKLSEHAWRMSNISPLILF